MRRSLLCLALLAVGAGCASLGVINDGSSIAWGHTNAGKLLNGVKIPPRGDGYLVPRTWAQRGNNFGTEELVSLVVRAARRVAREHPGSMLYVADLSPPRGGPSAWHRSHQTGRDVDLLFYALDADGRPAPPPPQMVRFGDDGVSLAGPRLVFDTERNWALLRALLEDPAVEVQHVFVYEAIEHLLLQHAVEQGEPDELVQRAAAVMQQPTEALPHDDHFHVRIYCPVSDRAFGCKDRGHLRWFKKSWKYLQARRLIAPLPEVIAAHVVRPFCQLLSRTLVANL